MNIKLFKLVIFVVLILSAEFIAGQQLNVSADSSLNAYDLFENDDILQCTLTFDIKKFKKEKHKDKYQKASFTYYSYEGDTIENDIKLKARGVSRKKFCHFPPIKLKFDNNDDQPSYFKNIKSLKLVTHCKSSDEFEQYLYKEFIVYKLYNALTDKSFRVKMVHLIYDDYIEKTDPIIKYGFLIENPNNLADRNNAYFVKDENLGLRYIEPDCIMTLSLFQFMIGNPDWSISGLHNIKLLKSKNLDELLPYAVPYDFDNTGLVNPDHARPPENSGINDVRERKFEGICKGESEYDAIKSLYNSKHQVFITIIDELDLLEKESKEEMKEYIDSFYILLNSQDFYKDRILPYCKK